MLLSSSHRDKTEGALHNQQSTKYWYYYATKYDTWRPIAPQQVPQQVRQNVRTIPQYVQYPQYLATMSPIVAPIKTLPSIQSHVILDCKRHTLCGNPENRTKKTLCGNPETTYNHTPVDTFKRLDPPANSGKP